MENYKEINDLAFWMWFTILFIIGLIFFIVLVTRVFYKNVLMKEQILNTNELEYQKELLKMSISVQEKERNRIAQDIHDGLISQLNIIRLSMKDDEKEMSKKIQTCMKMGRQISHDLMPPFISQMDLSQILENIILRLEIKGTVKIHKKIQENNIILDTFKLQLIRIIQEVTNNIIKHSKAKNVKFLLRITQNNISIKIEDDGVGFIQNEKIGLGFQSIIARVQLLNGVYKYKSKTNIGTVFLLCVPVNQNN